MRYFSNRSQLARMDFHTRLIMTYFLVFMLACSALSIFMSHENKGLSAEGSAAYYLSDEEQMKFAKEKAELVETARLHLFIMPVVFLTTGHLFLLGAWSARWKTFVISFCFVYIALEMAEPWLVRYIGAAWGVLAPINAALLGMTMLHCMLVPICEMSFLKAPRCG